MASGLLRENSQELGDRWPGAGALSASRRLSRPVSWPLGPTSASHCPGLTQLRAVVPSHSCSPRSSSRERTLACARLAVTV